MSSTERQIDALRQRIADACCVLGELDITASVYGHVSGRLPGTDRIFIRARGPAESGVRYTTAEDVIEVSLDGARVGGADDGRSAPMEVFIHTELYRKRSDVFAVTHMHPVSSVLLTSCNLSLAPIFGAHDPFSLSLALQGVPTFERSVLIRTPDLGRALAECMDASAACLMRGHGVTTAAHCVEDAALWAIHLNTIAALTCEAHAIGSPAPISEADQEEFRVMWAATQAQDPPRPGVPSKASEALWRYYLRLTRERLPQ